MSFGMSGGGTESKGKENFTKFGSQTGTQSSTPQWWGNQMMNQVIPASQQGFGQLMKLAQNPSNYQFNPQQQANWQNAMSIGQQGNPYQMAGQSYINPVLQGGWQQYYDAQNNASALQAIQGALPGQQEEFIRQATKGLAGTPYATGSNAAALGAGYGNLKLSQAQQLAQQYELQAQQTEQAKSIYGQQVPGLAAGYAQSQDPSSWFNTMNQMAGAPEAYRLQQTGGWGNILGGAAQGLYGMGMGAYTTPQRTDTSGTYYDTGRTTTDTKSGGGSGSGGGSCCFIFMEGNMLMPDVRKYRDAHYPKLGIVSKGYRAMASWLVPKMRKSTVIRKLTMGLMLYPLAYAAKLYYQKNPAFMFFIPVEMFWCWAVWGTLGLMSLPDYSWKEYYATKKSEV